MQAASKGSSKDFISVLCKVLEKKPKSAILFGIQGIETGFVVSLVTSKSKQKILDGWSVDLFGGKRLGTGDTTIGAGVEKRVYNNLIEIGVGVFATKPVHDFFKKESWDRFKNVNLSIGLTGGIKF